MGSSCAQDLESHELVLAQTEQRNFLLKLLHGLLCFYLILHNWLIPLLVNWQKHWHWDYQLHFWPLFQLTVATTIYAKAYLEKFNHVLLLWCVGAVVRILLSVLLINQLNWALLSIFLSELSGLIFIAVAWKKQERIFISKNLIFQLSIIAVLSAVLTYTEHQRDLAYVAEETALHASKTVRLTPSSNPVISFEYPDVLLKARVGNKLILGMKHDDQMENQLKLKSNLLWLENSSTELVRLKISYIAQEKNKFKKTFLQTLVIPKSESIMWKIPAEKKSFLWLAEEVPVKEGAYYLIFTEDHSQQKGLKGKWLITANEVKHE